MAWTALCRTRACSIRARKVVPALAEQLALMKIPFIQKVKTARRIILSAGDRFAAKTSVVPEQNPQQLASATRGRVLTVKPLVTVEVQELLHEVVSGIFCGRFAVAN